MAWFCALEVATCDSAMLHMLSTLKLILYGVGVSVRKAFRARRQSNPVAIFTMVQDPFQPPPNNICTR